MRDGKVVRATSSLIALACALAHSTASATTTTTVSGYFDDPANTALISSNGYGDLGAPQFGTPGNDDDVARNVAIYRLVVQQDGSVVQFVSTGYANGAGTPDGGAEAYFSLFAGGDVTASFVDSSYYDQRIDFQLSETLAAGTYLFTIGVFENESFAENDYPTVGTLSDGFTVLGDPDMLGNDFYQVAVTSDAAVTVGASPFGSPTGPGGSPGPNDVPEPGEGALLGIGFAAFDLRRRHRADARRDRHADSGRFRLHSSGVEQAERAFLSASIQRPVRDPATPSAQADPSHPTERGVAMSTVPSFPRRVGSIASIVTLAGISVLAAPQVASAQARPALTRDADNADLAPAVFAGTFQLNTAANTVVTTVPAGKRLVIDNISYSYTTLVNGDPLNQAFLYTTNAQGTFQARQYFPINPPHVYTSVNGSTAQDASFYGRTYFEAGEVVRFLGGTPSSDPSRSIGLTITGHYVTP